LPKRDGMAPAVLSWCICRQIKHLNRIGGQGRPEVVDFRSGEQLVLGAKTARNPCNYAYSSIYMIQGRGKKESGFILFTLEYYDSCSEDVHFRGKRALGRDQCAPTSQEFGSAARDDVDGDSRYEGWAAEGASRSESELRARIG
jgi:hypothetical protein